MWSVRDARATLWFEAVSLTSMRMGVLGSDFDEFVRDSSPRLLRIAHLLTGDRGHAEDIVQTTLLQVARKWRRIRGEPAPYARRAVVNLAKNHRRDRSRRPHENTATIEPFYAPPEADVLLQHVLLPAVMDLPIRQRAVLVLRYFQDLSVEQTADALGCSIGTVKSQTHHALNKLREALGDPVLGGPAHLKENEHAH
jgi:RNA polymerase sigma-70 factor (sigma-E family)